MIPQINAMTKMMRLMWTYSLMAIICQLGNPVVFMTSWTHANKGCLCVSIGLQRPMGVQIGNLRFKRVPTGVSVDALTMCSFVKIALLWTSWWYPKVHATLCHSGVTEDHMSRGHHLEQRQSLLMWNKYKLFFKPLCLVFVDSNRTMSSSIGAIWSFISDFISLRSEITNNMLLIQCNYTTNLEIGVCALFALTESIDLCWQRQTTLLHHWVQLLWVCSPWWATPDSTLQRYSSATSLLCWTVQ